MSGEKKGSDKTNTMNDVDFDKQERELHARAAKFREATSKPGNKHKVVNRRVDIFSDGTRMSGTIWMPEETKSEQKLPSILLAHGWGGKCSHLDFSYAPTFAKAGYLVLTFDYRTWGQSDGVVVPAEKQPRMIKTGETTMKVKVIRKVIDPEWQLRDVTSAFDFMMGLENVDVGRLGIWGSSFGGGHVLALAAKDHRVRAVVSQIGSINTHSNWVNRHPDYRGVTAIQNLATTTARGEIFPWTIRMPVGLDGSPALPKVVFEHTSKTIAALEKIDAPVLILAAEKEELFLNSANSELVHEKLKGRVPTQIEYLPGGHYDAYSQPAYGKGVKAALDWFSIYIGTPNPKL